MRNGFALLVAVVSAAAMAETVPWPAPNPILPGFYSDPSVCRGADGAFYLATSTLKFFPGLPVFRSTNLVDWKLIGHVFTDPKDLPMYDRNEVSGLFAPTIRYAEGRYHLIVPNHGARPDGTDDGILYGTAARPEGPWTFRHANVPHADPSLDYIDGKWHYTATDGQWIYHGYFDPRTASVPDGVKPVWQGTGGMWPEGPHIFRRGDWYYILIAEGGTENVDHRATIARSRNPDGPYESCPHNPILSCGGRASQNRTRFAGTGHGDFITDDDGLWWYVFHGFRRQDGSHHLLGRETMLAPVSWTADGWPVVNGGKPLSSRPMNETKLPARDWTWIRTPTLANYVFADGGVELTAVTNTLADFGFPTFVGTRQTAVRQTFEAVLLSADDGVETGVAAYMNRPSHGQLVITRENGRRVAFLRSVIGGKRYEEARLPVGEGPLALRIEGREKEYVFTADGKEIGRLPARLISSETDCSYNGVIFGVFAAGQGKARFGFK